MLFIFLSTHKTFKDIILVFKLLILSLHNFQFLTIQLYYN